MLDIICELQLSTVGQEDGRGWMVKSHLGDIEGITNRHTVCAGPAHMWCWEVTCRRGEDVVHHQASTGEQTANAR